MNLTVPAGFYNPWKNFRIIIDSSIAFESGNQYHVTGANGAGKTSFIRKILIPQMLKNSSDQYIIYLEQQVQSQLDAVKAHAALQKPAVQVSNQEQMTAHLFANLQESMQKEKRPVCLILDECPFPALLEQTIREYDFKDYCLVYVAHHPYDFDLGLNIRVINFNQTDAQTSVLSYEGDN